MYAIDRVAPGRGQALQWQSSWGNQLKAFQSLPCAVQIDTMAMNMYIYTQIIQIHIMYVCMYAFMYVCMHVRMYAYPVGTWDHDSVDYHEDLTPGQRAGIEMSVCLYCSPKRGRFIPSREPCQRDPARDWQVQVR